MFELYARELGDDLMLSEHLVLECNAKGSKFIKNAAHFKFSR